MHLHATIVLRAKELFTKPLLIMKLTAILLLAGTLQLSAAGFSQTVSLSARNASLEKVFREIRKQTGYDCWYESDLAKKTGPITVQVKEVPLEQALNACFSSTNLTWRIIGKIIVVKERELPRFAMDKTVEEAIPLITVKGRVTDSKSGEPIVGASVMLKGSKKGVSTGREGEFTVTAEKGSVLVVSSVGYESQEISVKDGDDIHVRLVATPVSMKEMVVTGIYKRNKANFTGASTSFTAEDLSKVTNGNLLNALQTLDPAFQIPENIIIGSDPNKLPEVVLRGGNSLVDVSQAAQPNPFNYTNSPNAPLFILDGFEVPMQRINDLDMNRVIKVDILKDAAATSIYGSRAANGVIVIETLRPQSGKLRLSYNGNLEVEAPDLTGYHLLNAAEKLELERKTGVYEHNFNQNRENLAYYFSERMSAVQRGVNTDWLSQPLRTGIGQKHNLYLEGGAGDVQYGLSGTFSDRAGVMKGSGRQNIMANTFLSYRVKNFIFRNDFTMNFNKATNSPYGTFTQYTRLNPYWTPYDEEGNLKVYLEDVRNNAGVRLTTFDQYDNLDGRGPGRPVNPLYNAQLNIVDQTTYQNFVNNFFVQWQALQWLRVTGRLAYSNQRDEQDLFLPAQHSSFVSVPTFEKGSYTKGYGKRISTEGMLTADMNKQIDRHLFFGTLGFNFQESKFNTESFTVQGFPNPRLDQLTLGNQFPLNSKPTGTESIARLIGYLANLSYAFDSRYLVDLSGRLDGSSQFGTEKRMAPFWSAGIGWNLHNERWFRYADVVNRLKLRYSFGYTGSQNFESFLGLPTSRYYTSQEYRGVIGTYLLGFGNRSLAWQKTAKSNFGADITLWNRLDMTVNYFVETTKGSIGSVATAPSTGFSSYSENIGDLSSKGWELAARLNLISKPTGRDMWAVFVNAFSVKTKIKQVSNTLEEMNKAANSSYSSKPLTRYAVGQSTTAIWAVPSLGIDPSTGLEIFVNREGKLTTVWNPLDQVITGDARPDVEGTFGSNVEIKGIGMNVYFRFRVGGQAYNQTLVDRVENVAFQYYNVDRRVNDERWLQPGDHTFFRGLVNQGGVSNVVTYATSRFVQNDNLLSCESLSVYYRFPDQLNKRLGVQQTKITFFTGNLFRISGIDRERGLDYPFSHTYTLQLQTTF